MQRSKLICIFLLPKLAEGSLRNSLLGLLPRHDDGIQDAPVLAHILLSIQVVLVLHSLPGLLQALLGHVDQEAVQLVSAGLHCLDDELALFVRQAGHLQRRAEVLLGSLQGIHSLVAHLTSLHDVVLRLHIARGSHDLIRQLVVVQHHVQCHGDGVPLDVLELARGHQALLLNRRLLNAADEVKGLLQFVDVLDPLHGSLANRADL
mmetsp:Transcript_11235/g.21141  ORF Transcript_11235/g.21141 Transcript_11235/m.21141 type:complete len:206 (-) Transcript_11235:113-730(-)